MHNVLPCNIASFINENYQVDILKKNLHTFTKCFWLKISIKKIQNWIIVKRQNLKSKHAVKNNKS